MTIATARTRKAAPPATGVAVYVRVSSEEQVEGHSLDTQRDACLGWANGHTLDLFEVYEDAGFSAKSDARPAFQRLIEDAEAGRFSTVVVYKYDRFARSRRDSVVYKHRLKKAGVRLVSVTEPLDDTPAGLITEGMLELIAEWYSEDLKHKVTAGLRKRAEKGLMNAMPPFGYAQSATASHEPPVVVPEEAEAVRWAYETFATGTTMVAIAAELNRRGLRTRYRARRGTGEAAGRMWTSQSVSATLANPVYTGMVRVGRDVLPGRHEAIVAQELYDQVQRIRASSRGRPAAQRHVVYVLRGIASCSACGAHLHGNASKTGERHRYYRADCVRRRGKVCTGSQGSVRADWLEGEVDKIVAGFRMPEDVRDRVLDLLRDDDGENPEEKRAHLQERLRRLAKLYGDEQIGDAEYDAERRRVEAELDRLTVPVAQATVAAETFDVLQSAWGEATPEEKRQLAVTLFESIVVDVAARKVVDVVVSAPFRAWLSDWRLEAP